MLPIKLNKFYSHLSSYIARRLAKSRMRVAFCIHSILKALPSHFFAIWLGMGGCWLIEVMFPWTFLYKDIFAVHPLPLFYNISALYFTLSMSFFFFLTIFISCSFLLSLYLSSSHSFFLSFFLSFPLDQNKKINCCMESHG